jgi:hypothetical protein
MIIIKGEADYVVFDGEGNISTSAIIPLPHFVLKEGLNAD